MSVTIKCFGLACLALAFTGCGRADEPAMSVPMSKASSTPLAESGRTRDMAAFAKGWNPARGGSNPNDTDANLSSLSESATAGVRVASAGPNPQISLASYVAQRSVIRKATLTVRVTDIEKADRTLEREATGAGGYVDSASSSDLASDNPQMDITVRVPVDKFDSSLAEFEALGVELAKTVNSEDVTGQIVDLDARLRTLGAEEETYRGILKRTTALDQVISLQDKLTEVRSTMESMMAQRKTLGSLAALSTISVHLERSAEVIRPPADNSWLNQTWGQSTTYLGSVLRTGAVGAIWFLVFCPLFVPLAFALRWSVRRTRPASSAVQTRPTREPADGMVPPVVS